ncbi:MAG: hypothetical protein HC871_06605, partial [Rhizobiales bacterium]|nr:hypothetical protein [Hyphomicrobiales bacterium]
PSAPGSAVAHARRGARLKGEDRDLFEGQVWTGGQALENGLIDASAICTAS